MKINKRAVIEYLKSLIGPLCILFIIGAGILVITFWKNEAEPVEIIKVNGYEGEETEFVLENDKLKFTLDSTTTQFKLEDKSTKEIWYSNPPDGANDPLALKVEKDKLQSTLLLTYSTINGVDTLYNNYTFSMEKGIYEIEATKEYIKVFYSIGDMDKEYVIPPVIVKDRYDELIGQMSNTNALMVNDYYKKYDINKLGKKDNKEELLASYPILETEVIYVLRDTTKDNLKSKFEIYFADAGYTYEEYMADKELDFAQKTSEKPVFNVNMIYKLDGDDLIVEVPMSEIEYKEDYPLYSLNVLPFFGAGTNEENGFMMVPEGGGSIINFNNGKLSQNSYYANVYGWDMAQDRNAVVHETRTYYNVFGIAKEKASFLCILENGAPYASIQADISGRSNSYNYVNAIYNVVHREQYDVADKYNGEMFVYEDMPPSESIIQRYRFMDNGNYVDMAKNYGDYLTQKYGDYLSLNEDGEAPVVIDLLCAVDKVKQICGIPVSKPLKLTTFNEGMEIIKELNEAGMKNMSVKLSGWMNGGISQQVANKVNLIPEVGNKKDLQALTSYGAGLEIPVYYDGVTNYAYDSNIWDGFLVAKDAARFVSKEKAELYDYSVVTYSQRDKTDPYYLLKPSEIAKMTNNLASYAMKYGAGVSFRDLGKDLSSDFNRKEMVSRQSALDSQAMQLKSIKDSGQNTMVNMGQDYVIPYSDMVTNMDLQGSLYTIIDQTVPFYQIAIHGYVNYTGEALNLTQDYEEELLKSVEYGAGLFFTVMKESAFVLQKTLYTQYFGADYSAWKDKMITIYNRYNDELGHTFNQKMVNHEMITSKLACTTYEDGTEVYVNYSYEEASTPEGITIPARDYKVMK